MWLWLNAMSKDSSTLGLMDIVREDEKPDEPPRFRGGITSSSE
jgi:hypothetical protein